jgi:hypothetical protein
MLDMGYNPGEFEFSYNLKWTLLKHVQFICNVIGLFNEEDFPSEPGFYMPDSHLFDTIVSEFPRLPAFGVEYVGTQQSERVGAIYEDVYVIRYGGRRITIDPLSRYGVSSANRNILKIHDTVKYNLEELSSRNFLRVFDFRTQNAEPRAMDVGFSLKLLDSSFPTSAAVQRENTVDWTYSVFIDRG